MDPLIAFVIADDAPNLNFIMHLVDDVARPLDNNILHIGERNEKTRNENYYEATIPRYTDIQFKEHFRISRATMEELVQIIGNEMHDNQNHLAPLRKKVLFSIWILSKPESFLAAGDRFGLPASTSHIIFENIIMAIVQLMPLYIRWPNNQNQRISANIFSHRSEGIPGVVGAIDGCHIPCKQPAGNAVDFYNRKGFHSILLQGICDYKTRFIDCFIGLPGRMHDSGVFRRSPIFEQLTDADNPLLSPEFHLIGDAAYPLMKNLMTPFRDTGHLTRAQTTYNTKLSSIRSVIERAFGFLKGRFRRLRYLDISNFQLGNNMIAAACILHNFSVDHNELDVSEDLEDLHQDQQNNVGGIQMPVLRNEQAAQKRNRIVALVA